MTKERRAFHRHTTDIPAELKRGTGEAWPCQIVNFCSEGALLISAGHRPFRDPAVPTGIEPDQSLTLHFSIGEDRGDGHFAMPVRIVHVNRRKAGIAFSRLDPTLRQRLLDYSARLRSREAAATSSSVPACHSPADLPAVHAALQTVVQRHFPAIHREILQQCEYGLKARVTAASSDTESSIAYTDQTLFTRHAKDLLDLLGIRTQALVEAYEIAPRPTRHAELNLSSDLRLVEDAEFEAWLAVSELVHNLETELRGPLVALQRVFLGISGGTVVDVPFSPEAVGGLFQDLPERVDLSGKGRSLFFNTTGRVLANRLEPFYRDLIDNLEVQGYASATAHVSPVRETSSGHRLGVACGTGVIADIEGALELLQQQPGHTWSNAHAIRQQVMQLLRRLRPRPGDAVDHAAAEKRLEVAEHLLQSMFEDPATPTATNSWLEPLKPLLFQAAAQQPAFHREDSHPLTRIVGQLEHLGTLVGRGAEAWERETRGRIDGLVAGLLKGGLPRTQDVERVSGVLSVMEARAQADYQHNVARVVAACEGEARIHAARDEVRHELERQFGNRPLPKALVDVITNGWQALLQLTHIRHGAQSDKWATHWKTLEDLESMLAEPPGHDGARMERARALLKAVDEGLAYAASDPYQKARLIRSLSRQLIEPCEGDRAEPATRTTLALPRRRGHGTDDPITLDESAPPAGLGATEWRALLRTAAKLPRGSQLRIRDGNDVEQLRRIAWVDERRQRHVLVTARGFKSETLPWQQLALKLHAGQASVEEAAGRTLMDRAAERVLREMEEGLASTAWQDPMTGLYNRRQVLAAVDRSITATRCSEVRPALLMVDLDQFKLINNAYGFEAGDQVLIRVGTLLREQFQDPAVVARLAADEFAVLLPDTQEATALAAAEDLRQRIQEIPVAGESTHLRLEASVGVVFLTALHSGADNALSAAEMACAAAKQSGRNQVAVYRETDELIAKRASSMQSIVQLHEALDDDRIRLRCQRIAPLLTDGDKRGHYEVLLGVVGPDGAEVPLAPFISAAENFNRMAIVDQAVVRRSLAWMAQHPVAMESIGGFAINLSGDSINDPELVEFIAQAFQETGADPTKVCFEVTESLAIASLDRATEMIHRIKKLGCRFALDDFGSGMASYSYLKTLPVDLVKIDGTFVKDLAHSESDYAVVKSINEISHFLGKETIAEYVENDAIVERLRRIGVDYAQGFGIERPRYLADLAEDLAHDDSERTPVQPDLPEPVSDAVIEGPPEERPDASPGQSNRDRSRSVVGASTTPRSVTMASISAAGVTSKTGFQADTPGAPTR